jgi:hypothetical protein
VLVATVNQLLLREVNGLAGDLLVADLKGGDGGKGGTRATFALILD